MLLSLLLACTDPKPTVVVYRMKTSSSAPTGDLQLQVRTSTAGLERRTAVAALSLPDRDFRAEPPYLSCRMEGGKLYVLQPATPPPADLPKEGSCRGEGGEEIAGFKIEVEEMGEARVQ